MQVKTKRRILNFETPLSNIMTSQKKVVCDITNIISSYRSLGTKLMTEKFKFYQCELKKVKLEFWNSAFEHCDVTNESCLWRHKRHSSCRQSLGTCRLPFRTSSDPGSRSEDRSSQPSSVSTPPRSTFPTSSPPDPPAPQFREIPSRASPRVPVWGIFCRNWGFFWWRGACAVLSFLVSWNLFVKKNNWLFY